MDESDLLFRVFTNAIKMLKARGYIIPPEFEPAVFDKDAFLMKYASNDMGIVQRDDVKIRFVHQTERYRLLLLFVKCPKLGKKEVESICSRLDEVKRCIVVLDGNVSPPARAQIDGMAPDLVFEVFQEEQLLVNIMEHRLVPQHQPLTEAQKKAVLARYRVKATQLPRMEVSDPVARYFGCQRGDVVKITRASETAGRYTTYRYVF